MNPRIVKYEAAGIVDGDSMESAPGALLVEHAPAGASKAFGARVLRGGRPDEVQRHPLAAAALTVRLLDHVLLPGLVNAHAHLDLTHLGPLAHDPAAGFVSWIDKIRGGRLTDPDSIAASTRLGVERSIAGGVVAVGDIAGAGSLVPVETVRASPLIGVSFVEFFGTGSRQESVAARMEAVVREHAIDRGGVRLGLQPHAPYSAGLRLYKAAGELQRRCGVPLATHLAETIEERRFVAAGDGAFRPLLEGLGVWEESILEEVGRGESPISHLAAALAIAPYLLAHVNDVDIRGIAILKRTGARVVYCPRAHEYFGHESILGPHPYRRMMEAGIPVALGTDSIVNIPPTPAVRNGPTLSTLDEARLLWKRDGVDPGLLLRMITTIGAEALGLDAGLFRFSEGAIAGVVSVRVSQASAGRPPGERLMVSDAAPELLRGGPAGQQGG